MDIKKEKTFWILLFALIALRIVNLNLPLLEGTLVRQVQTASIAKNLYRDGFNLLYSHTYFSGNSPSYLVLEFPLFNFLVALLYLLAGGVFEWMGRILSILFFTGASIFLYRATKLMFNRESALWSVAAFGLSPLSIIFSRAFMPDFTMIFLCLGGLYFTLKYYKENNAYNFWISAVFMSLAMLVKPHSFYMLLPIFYLHWQSLKTKLFLKTRNWLYLLVVIIPAALWYYHGFRVHAYLNPESFFNYEPSNWFNPGIFLNLKFYTELIEIYSGIIFTPFGVTLLFLGLYITGFSKSNKLLWIWLLSAIAYLILVNTHITDPYYNLNFIPPAAIFISQAVIFLKKSLITERPRFSVIKKLAIVLLILPFWLRYTAYAYIIPKGYQHIISTCREIKNISQKNDLVVAANPGGNALLYYSERRGWRLELPGKNLVKTGQAVNSLDNMIKSGAKYFVCTAIEEIEGSPQFYKYLKERFTVVKESTGEFIVFSLNK